MAAGTAVKTYGAIQQGRAADEQAEAQQDIANYNARMAERQAEEERKAAAEEAEKFREKGERFKAAQRATYGRAGVLATEGTPLLVLEDTARQLEEDRLSILRQGYLKSEYLMSKGRSQRWQGEAASARGKNIKRGANLSAVGTLLSGAAKAGRAGQKMGAFD